MRPDRILVVNAGSSSLKLRVLGQDGRSRASRNLRGRPQDQPGARLARELAQLGPVDAVGHRVVHGGAEFLAAVLIDGRVESRLRALTDLDPLHQPGALAGMDAARAAFPEAPQVACFDTAFHAAMPPWASTYALPAEWRQRWGLRRYGFHGLSHAYAARRAAALLRRPVGELRLVTCHLGAGASLAAVAMGRSVDTTMGFTPLEGLVMATRSGSVDPGLLLWLERAQGLSPSEVADALEQRSGLLGLAGTADMRLVVDRAAAGAAEARLALEVYVHRLAQGIAAMVAAMGGLDALVFTGGVGERSAPVRRMAVARLGFLGLLVDEERNAAGRGDRRLEVAGRSKPVLVVLAREEVQIAAEVRELLGS